jgi:hypothetical protein
MDPIQPKENVGCKEENARFVTVDEFHVRMEKAANKGQQDKKDIYELMRAMRDKLMDVGNKGKSSYLFLNIGNFPFVLLSV